MLQANIEAPFSNLLLKNYTILLKKFGPQGWWPTTPPKSERPRYRTFKKQRALSNHDRFEICLGALLTQNTSWSNVEKVLTLLKANDSLSLNSIRKMPLKKAEKFFRSSGYFRQKARRVKNFYDVVCTGAKGDMKKFFDSSTQDLRQRLLSISGIGPETADSMLLYAGEHPIFVVDAYTRRIGERWGVLDKSMRYEAVQSHFSSALPASVKVFGEMHALLVKLAKDFCWKRNPNCKTCPLLRNCRYGNSKK